MSSRCSLPTTARSMAATAPARSKWRPSPVRALFTAVLTNSCGTMLSMPGTSSNKRFRNIRSTIMATPSVAPCLFPACTTPARENIFFLVGGMAQGTRSGADVQHQRAVFGQQNREFSDFVPGHGLPQLIPFDPPDQVPQSESGPCRSQTWSGSVAADPRSRMSGPLATTASPMQPTNWREELVRIDHNFTDNVRGTFRYIHDSWDTVTPCLFGQMWAISPPSDRI